MRSKCLDTRVGPFENLFGNPNLERVVPGSSVVRKNFVNNPRFERAVPGTTIVRKNLVPPKQFAAAGSGSGVAAPSTDRAWYGTNSFKSVVTSGTRGIQTSLLSVTPGRTYTLSFYMYVEGPLTAFVPDIVMARDGYTSVGILRVAPGFTKGLNRWVRYFFTYTVPAGASQIRAYFTTAQTDVAIYTDGLLIEERPGILPFFHGDSVNDRGIAYSWEGGVNASPSLARSQVTEVRKNLYPDPRLLSTSYANDGGANGSVTRVPTGGVNITRTSSTGAVGADMTISGLAPGDYMVSVEAVESGSFQFWNQSWAGVGYGSQTYLNGRIYVRVTLTSSDTMLRIRVRANALNVGESTFVDKLLIEAETGMMPYFDGTITPDADLTPMWRNGGENSDVSILYGVLPVGISPNHSSRSGIRSWGGPDGSGPPALRHISRGSGAGIWLQTDQSLVGGRTYTAIGTLIVPSTSVVPGDIQSRSILYGGAFGGGGTNQVTQVPNVPGTYEVRLTFTVDGGEKFLRYGGQSDSWSSVYWRNLLIVEGPYQGPYFDGDTVDKAASILYEWSSTPHGSISTMKAALYEIRRNYISNPLARIDGPSWGAQTPTGNVVSFDGTAGPKGASAFVVKTTSSGELRIAPPVSQPIPVIPGQSVTVAMDFYTTVAHGNAVMEVNFLNAEGNNAGWFKSSVFSISPGWSRLVGHVVAPANAVFASGRQIIVQTNVNADAEFRATNAVYTTGPYSGEYFDGNTSSDPDLVSSWLGAENVSPSIMQGMFFSGLSYGIDVSNGTRLVVKSDQWPGRTSARIVPLRNSTDTFLPLPEQLLRRGQTYTVMARIYLKAPLTGPMDARSRTIGWHENSGAKMSPPAPNVAGEHVIRVTATRDVDSAPFWCRLYAGSSAGGGDVLVDEVVIVEGVYNGPYFDGDIPNVIWRGQPHQSASVGYPPLQAA